MYGIQRRKRWSIGMSKGEVEEEEEFVDIDAAVNIHDDD